jgi:hypothetical protein
MDLLWTYYYIYPNKTLAISLDLCYALLILSHEIEKLELIYEQVRMRKQPYREHF